MWTLVLVFSIFSASGSVAVATTEISGFSSKDTCVEAGKAAQGNSRSNHYVCVEVK